MTYQKYSGRIKGHACFEFSKSSFLFVAHADFYKDVGWESNYDANPLNSLAAINTVTSVSSPTSFVFLVSTSSSTVNTGEINKVMSEDSLYDFEFSSSLTATRYNCMLKTYYCGGNEAITVT